MVISLFLFFNILYYSFQGIPTGIFCANYLRGIYVVEGGNSRKIEDGWNQTTSVVYPYQNLDVSPGDLIRFTCYNKGGDTYGAGCFLIYGDCYCYEFDINMPRKDKVYSRQVTLNDKECKMEIHALEESGVLKDYDYEYYVPLNANELTCINNNINNPLIVLSGVDKNLQLTNYISSAYSIKNVESSIIPSYYGYFKLNDKTLVQNQKFNANSQLTFNSKVAQKIYINFILLL